MRHKYATAAFVLARTPFGEASAFIHLLTPDLGLLRARAQSVRKPGAKLASALQTFSETDVILVRGKDGWRLSGAVLVRSWFPELSKPARLRAGRTAGLLLRLLHGESVDPIFFAIFSQFLTVLPHIHDAAQEDAAECLAALRILHAAGVDAGEIPGGLEGAYTPDLLQELTNDRSEYILRINRSIVASGL
ncbi:recombination protein O N-terminal domain-containing protein [Patescibacteria group bacterium]|nr:recombination protein O N-terminal domain-containing protein [Patescibacteria group bacterium]